MLEPVIFVREQLEADLEGIRSWVIQNTKFRNLDYILLGKEKSIRTINHNTDKLLFNNECRR